MASTHKHLRSGTADKRPTTSIAEGQIALNTNATSPGLFFKDSTGATIIKVGPVHVGTAAPNAIPAAGGSTGNSTGEVWLDTSLTPVGVKIWNGTTWVNATPSGSTTVQGLLELATNAETQAGSDTVRAVTPASLQSKVSDSVSTTSSTTIASSTAVKAAYDLAAAAVPAAGGVVTGNLEIGTTGSLTFEGSVADGFETTLGVVNPTADRSILLPNVSGTVVTTGDTGSVTSAMIADGTIVSGDIASGTIVDANISATAEIAVSKLADGSARQLLQTDSTGNNVEWTSNVDIPGTLDVTSTATFDSIASIPAGSAVAPTLTFTGDTNTGLYSPGADQVALATGGTGRLFVDASGNVGVNVSAPSTASFGNVFRNKAPAGTGAAGYFSEGANSDTWFGVYSGTGTSDSAALVYPSTGSLRIATSTSVGVGGFSEKIRITSAGLVGIGTSAPNAKFEISAGHIRLTPAYRIGTGGTGDTPDKECIRFSDGSLDFLVANTERARIDSSGRLGIGTSSPAELLDIKGNIVLGAQNSATTSITPTSASGTNIAGTTLIIRAGLSTGSAAGGSVAIVPSTGSGTSGTGLNDFGSKGLFVSHQATNWGNNASLYLLRVLIGLSSDTVNRSNLGNDGTVVTIDGASNGSQSALEIVGSNNSTGGDQGFIRFYGSSSKNPYATIVATTPSVDYTSGNLAIRTYNAGVESTVATFTNTGRLGIGSTPTAGNKLHVAVDADGDYAIYGISPGASGLTGLNPDGTNGNVLRWGGVGANAGVLRFMSGVSTERARIDSSGRLLVGTSSARTPLTHSPSIQVEGVGYAASTVSVIGNSNDSNGAYVFIGKSRGTTVGSNTVVQSGDEIGGLDFIATDGTQALRAARITANVDGTPGANDMPGRIVLSTTADGASSPTERMRITNAGFLKASNSGSYGGATSSYHEIVSNQAASPNISVNATSGSFTSSVLDIICGTAASTAYNLARFFSTNAGDLEFSFRGDGNAFADGSWTGGGADYAEYFEWSDGNPDVEDRRGISVVLDGDKIREALAGEDPIGVISGNPSIVGDAAWNKWTGKYLRDEFGTYILEDYEVEDEDGNTVVQQRRKLNPAFDPDAEYIPREQRPEWDCVGLMGKLRIRKGQVSGSRWIKMRDISDTVEEWLVR